MSSRTKIEGERGTVTEFRLTGRHTPAAAETCSTNIQGLQSATHTGSFTDVPYLPDSPDRSDLARGASG